MSMNQKEATYQAICSVTGHNGEGVVEISKEQRAQVNLILFEGFRAGTIALEREFTDVELKSYVSGLQSNWIRKDKRLNGDVAYVAKSPGSRAGTGDPQLKAMRALLSTVTDDADRAEVQKHIDARTAEIMKAKAPTVDFSKLPPELAAKFNK
jgi:hypothetical protein